MLSLISPIESVPKIHKKIIPALKKLGIRTLRDLLFHLPARYEDFSNKKDIKDVAIGEVVTIQGVISKIQTIRIPRRRMVLVQATAKDASGSIRATWFNQPFLARTLKEGEKVNLSGKIAQGPGGKYLQNPSYEKTGKSESIHTGGLIAIYPETRGITSRWLRFLIKNFIELRKGLTDPLPEDIRKRYQLPEVRQAIFSIHFPKNLEEAKHSRRRFNFEELLLIQLRALQNRVQLKEHSAPAIQTDIELIKKFVFSLPFSLTDAQRRSLWEILRDLAKPRPMNRLLEGDVGSGKTVVAAASSLAVVKQGFQVAFMAPTEILALQHFETLKKLLRLFGAKIGLLTGSQKISGEHSEILVGTHALIQNQVKFEKLGLVIVDEQHRFGVEQRAALVRQAIPHQSKLGTGQARDKRQVSLPHFLSMSATPIPRTLALTVYGDLDLSILDEMPKSRKEIITKIVEPEKRKDTYQFIREEIKRGRQTFVICPRIEIPEPDSSKKFQQKLLTAEVKSVKEEYKKLSEQFFQDLRVGMLHGKMKAREKAEVMRKFKNGKIDILVSTSVIEVGVDVPNATVMMIEGAEKFGLAQLHQFRGRVGRSADQSYCFLFTGGDGIITRRLRAVVDAKTGFELAEKDLEIRGAGDLFGTRQWGVSNEVISAMTDSKLVREVREAAVEIFQKDPSLKKFPILLQKIEEQKQIHPE